MQNSATINSVVTQGGTINSTVTVGTTIQSTLTGGGIGPKGSPGSAGTPGSVWHEGAGAPSTLFANGDFYLNTTTGDIYVQISSSWGSPVGNIKGPAGPTGSFPYFNVQNYGAAGDNTHDDTSALQAAINAAAILGGTVFFPSGTYKITSTLTMYTGVSFLGEGSEASVIKQYTANSDCLYGNDVASITLEQIRLEGPSSTPSGTGRGINFIWTSAGNVPFMNFRDLWVRWFGGTGIAIETPIVSHFDRVLVDKNGQYGFDWYHAGTSCTFTSCWARNNVQAGYHFFESVYQTLNACAADGNGNGYLIESAQSIDLIACGAESQVVGAGIWDGTGIKVSNSSVIGIHNAWFANNPAIALWITNGSQAVEVFGAADNSPGVSATAFVQTDVSTNSTLSDIHNTTANSYSAGTVTVLNDGANNLLTKQLQLKDSSGSLHFTATSDGAGGQFSIQADTTGILDIFGQGGQTLNVNLLDGYLQLSTLTASTVPYMDANKRFASSAITPTQLGYLSPATGNTGTGNLVFASSPTITSLTVNTLLTANTELDVTGTNGTIKFTAATDGGDFNIFSTATGTKTLAIYGSSSNTLNLNLLDGALLMGGNTTISNTGVLTNVTLDSAGTGNSLKVNGTALTAVTGTGSVVLATSPTLVTPALGTPSAINLTNAAATSLPISAINATGSASSTTFLRGDGTWGTPSGSFTNPMTTLGDIIYENSTPAAARLAGNTTTTKQYLSQTGNGTISAAPAWATIAAADLSNGVQGSGAVVLATSPTITTPTISGHFTAEGVTTTGAQGTGALVFATSPTLTTPTLGAATATTINKVTITAPTTSATLTLITGSSLITAGAFALTLTSTATTNSTFPSGTHTLAGLDVAQSWTAVQTYSTAPAFNALPTGTAVASAATASTLMSRDSNGNTVVTNLQQGYTSTATAAGTTTLTVASNQQQVFTGSSTQTVVLPAVSTLTLGTDYVIANQSTGNVTIQSSGANNIVVLGPNQIATVISNATSGTGAAVWNYSIQNAHYNYRNNNGSSTTEANSHMETGEVGTSTGAVSAFSVSVTWAKAFTSIPIVVASPAGDASSNVGYGSAGFNVKRFAVSVTSVSTSGASLEVYTTDGTAWASGNFAYFTYAAIGI